MEKEGKLGGDDDMVSSNINDYKKIISSDQVEKLIISDDDQLKRGPWTVEEDFTLINYIAHHGEGRWNSLARCAGLKRTGKSCRLRWLNYLRPDVRRGNITLEEQLLILELHSRWGNRWSKIAQHLPGRTDNEIKNYWRTRVQKHAKHLKCDVNSNQFKDTMRYLWMPRLVERSIQSAPADQNIIMMPDHDDETSTNICGGGDGADGGHTYTPENPSTAALSDSFGMAVSDLTESCYNNNNYPINYKLLQQQQGNINQDCYYNPPAAPANNYYEHQLTYAGDHQSLSCTSPTGYFDQGTAPLDFTEQNCSSYSTQWMDGGDVLTDTDSLWNVDDIWFLHHQFNTNV